MRLLCALSLALLSLKYSSGATLVHTEKPQPYLVPRDAYAKDRSPQSPPSPEPFWPEALEPPPVVPVHPETPPQGQRWRRTSNGVGSSPLRNPPETQFSQATRPEQHDSTPAVGQLYAPYEGEPFLTYPRPGAAPAVGSRPAEVPLPSPNGHLLPAAQTPNMAPLPPSVAENPLRPRPPPHYSSPPIRNPFFQNRSSPPSSETPSSRRQRGRSRERGPLSPPPRRSPNPSPPTRSRALQRRNPTTKPAESPQIPHSQPLPDRPQPDLLTQRPPSPRFTSFRHGGSGHTPLLPMLPHPTIPPSSRPRKPPAASALQQPATPHTHLPFDALLSLPPSSMQPPLLPMVPPSLRRPPISTAPLQQQPAPPDLHNARIAPSHQGRLPNPPKPALIYRRPTSPRFTSFRADPDAFSAFHPPIPSPPSSSSPRFTSFRADPDAFSAFRPPIPSPLPSPSPQVQAPSPLRRQPPHPDTPTHWVPQPPSRIHKRQLPTLRSQASHRVSADAHAHTHSSSSESDFEPPVSPPPPLYPWHSPSSSESDFEPPASPPPPLYRGLAPGFVAADAANSYPNSPPHSHPNSHPNSPPNSPPYSPPPSSPHPQVASPPPTRTPLQPPSSAVPTSRVSGRRPSRSFAIGR